jgi:putative peptide zinc metalloprotease protein
MEKPAAASEVERRKQVRIRIRTDLNIAPQKYEGRTYYVVKDPVSLRYYRFEEQENFIIGKMDGTTTLDDTQKEFEEEFRPKRLTLEDLEHFAQQLLTAGLAHNESPQAGTQLFERRKKRRRSEWTQALTNILYIKIPLYDPDKLLTRMVPYTSFIFTGWFFAVSVALMLSAVALVATHFETFLDKLPAYHEFFNVRTVFYLWGALGIVKVIHEFGHGLSCKTFGREVHEMGALFLCLSPCLYCNVSDAWTLPNKWKRIIISFAGIYVELVIAAIATFVWWNSSSHPFVNHMSLSLMVVCSVSTVVFNANPLMRFDGYYVMADWLEIPNLRDRANRFLLRLFQEHCLGMEVQPESYMSLDRKVLFVVYAVVSYVYRWVITFSILFFFYRFLRPYKLEAIGSLLSLAAAGSMVGWPIYRLGKSLYKRGRMPDMKSPRVTVTAMAVAALILFFFLVPMPVSRVRQIALVQVDPAAETKVRVHVLGQEGPTLEKLYVTPGQPVQAGDLLAKFRSMEVENQLAEARSQAEIQRAKVDTFQRQMRETQDSQEQAKLKSDLVAARGEMKRAQATSEAIDHNLQKLEIRAPCSGIVMTCPMVDAVGRAWEKEQSEPFCTIGDPTHLRLLMAVPTADYRLLSEQMAKTPNLPATVRIHGRAEKLWRGTVTRLQPSEASEVPAPLASKFGGNLAVKPTNPSRAAHEGQQPNYLQPQTQQYMVEIALSDPDRCIEPGTLAQVKINCEWRSCAWWVWRTISSTVDVRLV